MIAAYILVQTEVGKAAQVAKDIVEIKGVQLAEDVTGPYDVIVRAEARTASRGRSPVRWCACRAARPPSGVRPTATATAT